MASFEGTRGSLSGFVGLSEALLPGPTFSRKRLLTASFEAAETLAEAALGKRTQSLYQDCLLSRVLPSTSLGEGCVQTHALQFRKRY